MNKRLNLLQLGGLPLTQKDLDWLQGSYRSALSAISDLFGDKVIISGMIEAGGEVTAGWISIGGELVPFAAGAIGTGEFTIQETATPRIFHDGISKDVRIERVALFSAGGAYQYSQLTRIGTLKNDMPKKGDIKMVKCDGAYIAENFDGTGLGINERMGWAICNGNNTTEDMGDMFPMAYKTGVREMGDTGGTKQVTLATGQQGKLAARVMVDDIGGGTATVIARIELGGIEVPRNGAGNQVGWGTTINAPLSAATDPIDKMNPFKTLLFIQKL